MVCPPYIDTSIYKKKKMLFILKYILIHVSLFLMTFLSS